MKLPNFSHHFSIEAAIQIWFMSRKLIIICMSLLVLSIFRIFKIKQVPLPRCYFFIQTVSKKQIYNVGDDS